MTEHALEPKTSTVPTRTEEVNVGHLKAFIGRIEQIEVEIYELTADRKDIYAEAEANGFDAKIMRKIVAIRKQDRDRRREEAEILNLYMEALGIG